MFDNIKLKGDSNMETNAILVALEEGKTIVFFRSIEPRYYMKKGSSLFYSDDISNKNS